MPAGYNAAGEGSPPLERAPSVLNPVALASLFFSGWSKYVGGHVPRREPTGTYYTPSEGIPSRIISEGEFCAIFQQKRSLGILVKPRIRGTPYSIIAMGIGRECTPTHNSVWCPQDFSHMRTHNSVWCPQDFYLSRGLPSTCSNISSS